MSQTIYTMEDAEGKAQGSGIAIAASKHDNEFVARYNDLRAKSLIILLKMTTIIKSFIASIADSFSRWWPTSAAITKQAVVAGPEVPAFAEWQGSAEKREPEVNLEWGDFQENIPKLEPKQKQLTEAKEGAISRVPGEVESAVRTPASPKWGNARLNGLIGYFRDYHYNEKALDYVAVTKGHGYKAANLIELQNLCESYKAVKVPGGCNIKVPTFACISSNEIIKFLQEKCNFNINTAWEALPKPELQALFDAQKFPDGFLDTLKKNIEDVVLGKIKNLKNVSVDEIIQSFSAETQAGIRRLFAEIHDDDRLVIRSTGPEDKEDLANAGGNESVANVQKEVKDILNAMAIVVSSYFSTKSMTQRLCAKDTNLFRAPFIPVLFQKMIGEVAREKPAVGINAMERKIITRCGVMYTEEPEGGIYNITNQAAKASGGKTRTLGLTLIQSSYGYNEGVVNSIVPVDSIYVDRDIQEHSVVVPKLFRLVPTTKAEQDADLAARRPIKKLKRIDNAPVFANRISLHDGTAKDLKFIADLLEAYYQKPMDVEFVIDENTATIFLVQARPIPHAKTEPASHLTIDFNRYKNHVIDAEMIVGAGGALKFISDPKQIIIEESIGQALRKYQDQKTDKKGVVCVVIGENAPTTSHESATFRGEGKPVMYLKDFKKYAESFKQSGGKFVVDVQQGKIVNWAMAGFAQKNLAEILSDHLISSIGWFSYPIHKSISLYSERKINDERDVPTMESVFGPQIKNENFADVAAKYQVFVQQLSLHFFIQKLKSKETRSQDSVFLALSGLLHYIGYAMQRMKKSEFQSTEINILNNFILYYCKKILNLWKEPQPDDLAFRMNYLFLVNKLEALIYQQPKNEILNGYSVAQILRTLKEDQQVRSAPVLANANVFTVQLAKLGLHALTPELRNDCVTFVAEAQTLNKYLQFDLRQLVLKIAELDVSEMWLHTSFAQSAGKNAQARLTDLLNEVFVAEEIKTTTGKTLKISHLKPFLSELSSYKQKIDALNLEGVVDPSKFLKVWEDFFKNVLSYFISDEFKTAFVKSQTKIEKLVAITLMEALISKYDSSIKAMENSGEFKIVDYDMPQNIKEVIESINGFSTVYKEINEKRNRIFTFSFMLYYYFIILQQWYDLLEAAGIRLVNYYLSKDLVKDVIQWPSVSGKYTFAKALLSCSKQTNKFEQLQVRPDGSFNVNISMLGSGADLCSGELQTLEEFFTFTHQSIAVIIGKLLDNYGPPEESFPNVVKRLISKIRELKLPLELGAVYPLSKKLENKSLILKYNCPLGQHSALINIEYKSSKTAKQKPLLNVSVAIFGDDQCARFSVARDYVEIYCSASGLTPDKTVLEFKQAEKEIQCTWAVQGSYQDNDEVIAGVVAGIELSIMMTILTKKLPIYGYFSKEGVTQRKIGEKTIELSAQDGRSRICLPLDYVVDPTMPIFYLGIPNEMQKQLLRKILDKLADSHSDYSINTKILLYKNGFDLLNAPEIKYYGITKDNFNLEYLQQSTSAQQARDQKYYYELACKRYDELNANIKKMLEL